MKFKEAEYYRIVTLRTVGNFLILSSFFMMFRVLNQPIKEEINYYLNSFSGKKFVVVDPSSESAEASIYNSFQNNNGQVGELGRQLKDKNVEFLVPVDPEFSIVVPKIGANANILKNVTTVDKDLYLESLKQGVAHAEGTAFPGEKGHIFLFAHSTDYVLNVANYNAVFYLLYKLEVDDEVNLFFKGKRYVYRVTGKQIVDPSEVEYLTRKTDSEFLTLQTCWPPGTTFKRQLVFAEPVSNLP